ncbi:DUF2961 domain-containing protein [Jiangella anatolica]|uniref:DUF2961 domain-containing protein n=1 Tax=Jiangella anatolica TaxID=2670374 RepID=A0A2W2BXF2_9ACTN|nr:DUF2961 domain-containing protein [Jiangella anatolica]PZF85154.1 hypothetical protein C1I92_06130 [Jiangella anatolica]
MTGPLSNLPRLTGTRSARASSWDPTGGNDDRLTIAPGGTAGLAAVDEPGVVRHIWVTIACDDEHYLRNFVSAPLQMSPQDGKAFNCWFPMPFDSARIEVTNECATDVILYYYVDYELTGTSDPRAGRFHTASTSRTCGRSVPRCSTGTARATTSRAQSGSRSRSR